MSIQKPSRRDFARQVAAGVSGVTAFGAVGTASQAARAGEAPRRVLRLAHLTDVHVQPELAADQGLAACLRHVQSQAEPPQLILTGGDSIYDSFAADEARTRQQWDLWQSVWRQECSLPVRSCIGNHDVWGWDQAASGADPADSRYGKGWAVEALKLPGRYYRFDQAGWRFVVLDSTQPGRGEGRYVARLDDEQFAWLAAELAGTPAETPVCVLSHIPIITATAYFFGDDYSKSGDWQIPGSWVHIDALAIKALFAQHPQVKLCLSGHMHLRDQVDYAGVSYLCLGAVSGDWWKGTHQECPAGYALVDLFADGTFASQYVDYGWQPRG